LNLMLSLLLQLLQLELLAPALLLQAFDVVE